MILSEYLENYCGSFLKNLIHKNTRALTLGFISFAMDKEEVGCTMFTENYDVLSPNIHTDGKGKTASAVPQTTTC
jgi:hypothetical protein